MTSVPCAANWSPLHLFPEAHERMTGRPSLHLHSERWIRQNTPACEVTASTKYVTRAQGSVHSSQSQPQLQKAYHSCKGRCVEGGERELLNISTIAIMGDGAWGQASSPLLQHWLAYRFPLTLCAVHYIWLLDGSFGLSVSLLALHVTLPCPTPFSFFFRKESSPLFSWLRNIHRSSYNPTSQSGTLMIFPYVLCTSSSLALSYIWKYVCISLWSS